MQMSIVNGREQTLNYKMKIRMPSLKKYEKQKMSKKINITEFIQAHLFREDWIYCDISSDFITGDIFRKEF